MFVLTEDDLNREQIDAILHPGSVFLTACPGSGKTRALTYKIARELSLLTSDKHWVVAITYTHRAADEIHDRIDRMGVDTSRLWIGTIHSFCLEWILRPYALYHSELRNGFRVIDSHETERRLAELCRASVDRIRPFECNYYFTADGCQLDSSDRLRRAAILAILERYWAGLRNDRQIDFEQILCYAYELVANVPSIPKLLGALFKYVLVDEYQDTKDIQYSILCAILRATNGSTAAFFVGDPNQAIFGSFGGYAISAEEFAQRSGLAVAEKKLSVNYRSSRKIVEYFSNFHVVAASIEAEGKDKDFSSVVSFDRQIERSELEAELVRLIRYNIEVVGVPAHEICVVAPWWVHLAGMTRRLMAALPEYSFNGPGMAPFSQDIDNFWYKLSRMLLTEPSPQLYIRRLRWAGEILTELDGLGADTRRLSRKELLRECNAITIDEHDGLTYLSSFFEELFSRLCIDFRAFPALAEHYAAFFASSTARIDRLRNEGIEAVADISMFRKVFASRSGITISTIHGVKGAEFDTVIAYALLEGMVPHFSDSDGANSAKKLLYVICSRARKNLHLVSERGRINGRGNPYRTTQILADCPYIYDRIPDQWIVDDLDTAGMDRTAAGSAV